MPSDRTWTFYRIMGYPFSLLYGLIIWIRNYLYDRGILPSSPFNLPIVCIGNLSVGGTGKSPLVEYLIREFKAQFRLATLSRGYKRKTRGYVLAGDSVTAIDIGDEPMQFHRKFPGITVAVGEERMVAIPQLLHDRPETEVIFLDDGFQHRAVRAGLNILLTDYSNLFTRDQLLPAGSLRDLRSSARRADLILVTKCPEGLTEHEATEITREIGPAANQQLFFTTICYARPYHILTGTRRMLDKNAQVLLITGIANPRPLLAMVNANAAACESVRYRDHHIYSIDDWRHIRKKFDAITREKKWMLTTEKDAVRLIKFRKEIDDLPLYVLPVEHQFLFGKAAIFNEIVREFIRDFHRRKN